jgi:tetrahydromethanopterin S-methyltransferase subunit C
MGWSAQNVVEVSAAGAARGVASPADISMDIGALLAVTGAAPRAFEAQVTAALEGRTFD